jgi:hypothetical protein
VLLVLFVYYPFSTACLLSIYSIYYILLPPFTAALETKISPCPVAPCLETRDGMEALLKLGRAWKGTAAGRCGGPKKRGLPRKYGDLTWFFKKYQKS